jgi:signal transduction histidine kinase
MKLRLSALSRRYLAALQEFIEQGASSRPEAARLLGEEAVLLGLNTPALARMHKAELASLRLPDGSSTNGKRLAGRAAKFFAAARRVTDNARCPAKSAPARRAQPGATPTLHTTQLSAINHLLERGLVRRKAAELALRSRGRRNARALRESQQLQGRLRHLLRQVLHTQESSRKKLSHQLQDEIAQTLLGINVRLLALKTSDHVDIVQLTKTIASTQRVVELFTRSISRFAREIALPRPGFREGPVPT